MNEVEKYHHKYQNSKNETNHFKQESERLTEKLSTKCPLKQSDTDLFQYNGLIIIARIRKIDDSRETDVCLGTPTTLGIMTSNQCCQADEMFFFDLNSSEELLIVDDSVWVGEDICLINRTNDFEIDIPISNDNEKKLCSVPIYDNNQEYFKTHEFQIEVSGCFEIACQLEIDSSLYKNQVILNGTLIKCDQSSYSGIVTKSKFSTFHI